MKRTATPVLAAATALGLAVLAGCGGSGDSGTEGSGSSGSGASEPPPTTVTLVTHDSFAVSDEVLGQFTADTGFEVEILRGGDAGVMVNQAVLTAGNPQGDVLFGVDNTLLSRALEGKVFQPHEAAGLDRVPEELRPAGEAGGEGTVIPVDTGDICVNYDRAWFDEQGVEPPRTLDDLTAPEYRDLLVVENPATSSPGLGFLLGTVAAYGEEGWQDYWQRLAGNGVEVVDGWEQAYYDRFSGSGGGSGGGDRPLVVSYATSPPAEVVYGSDPEPGQAPTGVSTGTCFRQVEYAGLLDGAANPEGGRALLDFLLGEEFQADVPLQMFVHPVREGVPLPEVFTAYGVEIADPYTMDPQAITDGRERWVTEWTDLVLR
ncbi:thiamine ABC transporter substrate binding subunit [Streptomyces sp. YIM 98790]|uniref:thiamine ABC transporter substrate-binding protein n=1 Tax=Streptomyces sp. YIM 98790 TaxID=2689077 RepID=UPI00140E740A|nr:thiamine ABC transporter substrate-binding protein [Streptomyces sp. YIM 98790]